MIDFNTSQHDLKHYYSTYAFQYKNLLFNDNEIFGSIKKIRFSNNLHKLYADISLSNWSNYSFLILPTDQIKSNNWKSENVKTKFTKQDMLESSYIKKISNGSIQSKSNFRDIKDINNLKIYHESSVSLGSRIIDCIIDYKIWTVKYLVLRNMDYRISLIHTSSIKEIDWDCSNIFFHKILLENDIPFHKNMKNDNPYEYFLVN